ncbi:MAG: DUF2397 family protein [Catenulispora sp.]|nr:DUF2397 family protein [Catenulispora sp.]
MDGEVAGATPPGATGGSADALTGLAFLLVPDSQAYQAILAVLAEEPKRSRSVGEVAAAVGADEAIVESRLAALVGWGDVSCGHEARTVAEYRAGAVRFGLSELGGRVWREVCRTSLVAAPSPVAAVVLDRAGLLGLARRFDECSDAEAVALYASAIGLPAPGGGPGADLCAMGARGEADETLTHTDREPGGYGAHAFRGPGEAPVDAGQKPNQPSAHPRQGPDGTTTHPPREPSVRPTPPRREPVTAAGPQPDPIPQRRFRSPPPNKQSSPPNKQSPPDQHARWSAGLELRGVASDLARSRLSVGAFGLLMELVGRALARTVPGSDGFVADESCGLELHLLHSPGSSTPLYGSDGTVTVDGFKVRLSALPAEGAGGL